MRGQQQGAIVCSEPRQKATSTQKTQRGQAIRGEEEEEHDIPHRVNLEAHNARAIVLLALVDEDLHLGVVVEEDAFSADLDTADGEATRVKSGAVHRDARSSSREVVNDPGTRGQDDTEPAKHTH